MSRRNASLAQSLEQAATSSTARSPSRAGSMRSGATGDTENTYIREYRPTFSSYTQYIFSVVAVVVSAKEIWRFPYTVLSHGGGFFIILFIFFTFTIGMPIIFLELIIGTKCKQGALASFRMMDKRAIGIGWSQTILSFGFLIYQPMIMAWSLYYIYLSFSTPLPWSFCTLNSTACCINDSTTAYWFEEALKVSRSLDEVGDWRHTHLLVAFTVTWLLAYACLFGGIRLGAFISYFTVTIPVILLPVIFVRMMFLEGARTGIMRYIDPNPKQLDFFSSPRYLLDLVAQILNTCGVAMGILITFKSRSDKAGYPTFEAMVIGVANMFISILSGAILFATLGYRMIYKKRGADEMFSSRGASIVFSVFPYVFEAFDNPRFWSMLFFTVLSLIMIDSIYGQVNAIALSLIDLDSFQGIPYSTITFSVSILGYLGGLPFVMGNGVYLFEVLDSTTAFCIVVEALVEVIYIAWIYGIDRFTAEVELETEFTINFVWRHLLKWFIPIILTITILGWCFSILVQVPYYMKYVACHKGGYKGHMGAKSWFVATDLSYFHLFVESLIFIGIFIPIPLVVWKYWPKKPDDSESYERLD